MAGGTAVRNDDVMKQHFEVLAEDVETLRRVITQQQQILEALRHQQGVVSGDTVRHESVILTLTTQADATMRSSTQSSSSLLARVEQLAISCHERPSREELSMAITSAVSPLHSKVEALDSSVRSPVDVRSTVVEVLGSMKQGVADSGNSHLAIELEEAKLALNAAKQQLMAQTQLSERLMSQSYSQQATSTHFTSQSQPPQDPAAMEEYWQRIQGFVATKLGEFETRMSSHNVPSGSAVNEDRVQALEKGLREANNSVSNLTAQLEQVRSSSLREVSEVRSAVENSDGKKSRQVIDLVESALAKESSRWERKLDDALESTVSRCRSACSTDVKYNFDQCVVRAATAAEHLVEASRASTDSLFSEAERRLKTSVEESRESISRGARKVSELEDRVDQVERSMRTDLRKLRDDMRDSSESDLRRFAQVCTCHMHLVNCSSHLSFSKDPSTDSTPTIVTSCAERGRDHTAVCCQFASSVAIPSPTQSNDNDATPTSVQPIACLFVLRFSQQNAAVQWRDV